MRIAVIGAGAMGSIYGGHLSKNNDVYLVDTAAPIVEQIAQNGLKIEENGGETIYHPTAVTTTEGMGFTGRGEGISALAVCLLEEIK